MAPSDANRTSWLSRVSEPIIYSKAGARIANFPPIAYALRRLTRERLIRAGARAVLEQPLFHERIARGNLQSTLKAIVADAVEAFDYAGAMVATYEPDGALPVRAWHACVSEAQVLEWEAQVAAFSPNRPISLTNSDLARVYINQAEFASNLSVQAYYARHPVTSPDLYDLFRPVVPESARPVVAGIQEALGVKQVIAVPFFIETVEGEVAEGTSAKAEFLGNLFALKRDVTSERDRQMLQALGHQVAAAILSERRRAYVETTLSLISGIQTHFEHETEILEHIVKGVVQNLKYAGAMVATYEPDGALPVRAWHASVPEAQVLEWEALVAAFSPNRPLSLTNPDIARVYINQPQFSTNLSVQAYYARRPVTSPDLYDLFRPVVPESARPVVAGIQEALGVKLVIAVPFFQKADRETRTEADFVGDLFVLSRSDSLDSMEQRVLEAFGQQAATGIKNAQLYRQVQELYRQAEDRRRAAAIFGKMAFSASASVHDLKNKIGVVRGFLQIVPGLSKEGEIGEPIFRNLDQMADMLDTLHEPFQQIPDTMISVEACVRKAVRRVSSTSDVLIKLELDGHLPEIYASQDMLVEVIKVLVKNAAEAVIEKGEDGLVVVGSRMRDQDMIEISVADNGIGIKPEDRDNIFDMRWSTKSSGLGFGLFWTKDYVTGIGGAIDVVSAYGEGTTFYVHIPVKTRRDEDSPGD